MTQTYSAHSFKDFTVKPGEDVSGLSDDAWLRAGSGFAVIGGIEPGDSGKVLERNQFDRKSQLRRSKKQQRKKSPPISPSCKTISASVDSSSSENGDSNEDDKNPLSVIKSETLLSSATPRTASGIVRAEMRSEKLTQILLNSSRTEYNSNYGNLI